MNIVSRVKYFCQGNHLLNRGDKILLAVSGGSDSIALLYIMNALRTELSLKIAVAHLEHGLRPDESARDQLYVEKICRNLQIDFYTKNVNVAAERNKDESPEEAARRVRYQYFYSTIDRIGFDKIATGHTLDDNIETIIFRLISGAGPVGFAGIQPKNGKVIHPLLGIMKEDTIQYLNHVKVSFRIDKTNFDNTISRNKIRNEVMPLLQSINNKFKQHILNLSKIIREEDAIIDKEVKNILGSLILKNGKGEITVDFEKFIQLNNALKRRIAILIIRGLTTRNTYIPFNIVEYLAKCEPGANKVLYYNDLFSIRKEYNNLIFEKRVVYRNNKKYLYIVNSLKDSVSVKEIKKDIKFTQKDCVSIYEKNKLYFDFDKIIFPIIIRNRRNGDRITLQNLGTKKLKTIFINDKVPTALRETVPILECNNEIVGIFCSFYSRLNRVAEKYRITELTSKILVCELV